MAYTMKSWLVQNRDLMRPLFGGSWKNILYTSLARISSPDPHQPRPWYHISITSNQCIQCQQIARERQSIPITNHQSYLSTVVGLFCCPHSPWVLLHTQLRQNNLFLVVVRQSRVLLWKFNGPRWYISRIRKENQLKSKQIQGVYFRGDKNSRGNSEKGFSLTGDKYKFHQISSYAPRLSSKLV